MESVVTDTGRSLRDTYFIWLEITSNCQLECSHCYAASGPGQGHGIVSAIQWMQTQEDVGDYARTCPYAGQRTCGGIRE